MTKNETHCSEMLNDELDAFQASVGKPKESARLLTGTFLDAFGGFARANLTVICGDSGSGKSAVIRDLAMSISEGGDEHVLLVPLQDGSVECAIKHLVAIEGNIPLAELDAESMSRSARIDVLDAVDGIRRHNLDLCAKDGLSLSPMLFEWAKDSFSEDLNRRGIPPRKLEELGDDALPSKGAILIDTMTLLADVGGNVREAVADLRMMAIESEVAIIATTTGADLGQLADAGCVIELTASEADGGRGLAEINACVLKDGTHAYRGRSAKATLDLKTLAIREG